MYPLEDMWKDGTSSFVKVKWWKMEFHYLMTCNLINERLKIFIISQIDICYVSNLFLS